MSGIGPHPIALPPQRTPAPHKIIILNDDKSARKRPERQIRFRSFPDKKLQKEVKSEYIVRSFDEFL